MDLSLPKQLLRATLILFETHVKIISQNDSVRRCG